MEYAGVPLYAFSLHGQAGVMLFFVISGYCIAAAGYAALISGKTVWRYSYDRIRRIYPPYLAALLLALLSIFAIRFASSHHLIGTVHHPRILSTDWRFWLGNVFLLQGEFKVESVDVVFWSLSYEIAFYCIIGVFLAIAKKIAARRNLHDATIFLVAAVGVSTVISLGLLSMGYMVIFPFDYWHQFTLGAALFFLIEFKPQQVSHYSKSLRAIVIGNAAIIALLTVLYATLRDYPAIGLGDPSSRWRCIIGLIFAMLLIGLRRIDDRLALSPFLRPLMWVGAFSYGLYLTHNVVIAYVDILSRKAGLDGRYYWIAFLLQLAVALAMGRIFYHLVERHFVSKRQVHRLEVEKVA